MCVSIVRDRWICVHDGCRTVTVRSVDFAYDTNNERTNNYIAKP